MRAGEKKSDVAKRQESDGRGCSVVLEKAIAGDVPVGAATATAEAGAGAGDGSRKAAAAHDTVGAGRGGDAGAGAGAVCAYAVYFA